MTVPSAAITSAVGVPVQPVQVAAPFAATVAFPMPDELATTAPTVSLASRLTTLAMWFCTVVGPSLIASTTRAVAVAVDVAPPLELAALVEPVNTIAVLGSLAPPVAPGALKLKVHVIAPPAASVAGFDGEQATALTVPRFALGIQVGLVAAEPPVLVQTSVRPVNVCPGPTAVGTTVKAGLMLATTTVVLALALLLPAFGSAVAELTVAVLLMTVPAGVAAATVTTSVKTEVPIGNVPTVAQFTVPPAPTAGLVQDQPDGVTSEAKVVPAGKVSAIAADAATVGPPLATVIE